MHLSVRATLGNAGDKTTWTGQAPTSFSWTSAIIQATVLRTNGKKTGYTIGISSFLSIYLGAVGETLEGINVRLQGLAVGLERGPLMLEDVSQHEDDAVVEVYRGVAVDFNV
ncbi:hypothetical protein QBC33DRAFT_574209 [Phialemonium atrogriseum]|uniref:Uncharacterized protein n=1 Tax=Phialemonium atrogriseum TaxID=1093897 RepID=A0AAJ0FCT6_9PEZI|nr:uncharacterized protein QBC33DRAFT_574209 [Phialemonium atrogriseum]KAK1762462.1 hypothetical protein QBC33DRAFT_574209 [Phialemonium atrogriseum]